MHSTTAKLLTFYDRTTY